MSYITSSSTIEERERWAYINGLKITAGLLGELDDARREVEELDETIDDMGGVKRIKEKLALFDEYEQFFHECFARLGGHYPAPSVTSDYDKSVIFDAIERGEQVAE